jgi:hypothetical protein
MMRRERQPNLESVLYAFGRLHKTLILSILYLGSCREGARSLLREMTGE